MPLPIVRGAATAAVLAATFAVSACGGNAGKLTELQRVRSGMLDVVLLSPADALHHGRDTFFIEFRSASDESLVDVGDVKASATMPMPGAPMLASVDVKRTDVPGRYEASSDFSMAGTWRTTIEWNGPAGQGSVNVSGSIQ